MTKKLKAEISLVFDDVASRYDSNLFFEISAQKIINLINHDDIKRMLDVATGTGTIALLAAEKYPQVEIEALDISTGMLNQAKIKASKKGLSNINFRLQDIESITVMGNKFDIITCGYAMFFLPNLENSLRNLYNRLNNGGQLIFSSFTKGAFSPYRDMFFELLSEYSINLPQELDIMLQTPKEIKQICQNIHITNIQIKSSKIRYMISLDDWWSLLNSAGYKGFLKQIDPNRINEFKMKHNSQIQKYSKSKKMLLITDSLYSVIQK